MRNTTITILMSLGLTTGCTAAKSAVGLLSPKAPNVTVVNTTRVEQAPIIVNVAPTPVIVQAAPIQEAPRKSRFSSLKAAASGAVAGAVVGTLVGYAVGGNDGAGKGAALGAGAGAVGGTVAHQVR